MGVGISRGNPMGMGIRLTQTWELKGMRIDYCMGIGREWGYKSPFPVVSSSHHSVIILTVLRIAAVAGIGSTARTSALGFACDKYRQTVAQLT